MKQFLKRYFGKKATPKKTTILAANNPEQPGATPSQATSPDLAAAVVPATSQVSTSSGEKNDNTTDALLAILVVCEIAKLLGHKKGTATAIIKPPRDLSKNHYYQKARRRKMLSA